MITAVDTSILLDILTASPKFLNASKSAYISCLEGGKVIVCPIVWSELRPSFDSDSEMKKVIQKMSLEFDPFDERSASMAGEIWGSYRKDGGRRDHLIPDFLIGAHAMLRAEQLLTRDRGFYRKYFSELTIVAP